MAKNINRKVTIYINGKEVENTIDSVRKEVRKLRAEQAKCNTQMKMPQRKSIVYKIIFTTDDKYYFLSFCVYGNMFIR